MPWTIPNVSSHNLHRSDNGRNVHIPSGHKPEQPQTKKAVKIFPNNLVLYVALYLIKRLFVSVTYQQAVFEHRGLADIDTKKLHWTIRFSFYFNKS